MKTWATKYKLLYPEVQYEIDIRIPPIIQNIAPIASFIFGVIDLIENNHQQIIKAPLHTYIVLIFTA